MDVNFFATLRDVAGARTLSFDLPEGVTVKELLDAVLERFPETGALTPAQRTFARDAARNQVWVIFEPDSLVLESDRHAEIAGRYEIVSRDGRRLRLRTTMKGSELTFDAHVDGDGLLLQQGRDRIVGFRRNSDEKSKLR